jgi:hypothetical protein
MKLTKLLMIVILMFLFVSAIALGQAQDNGKAGVAKQPETSSSPVQKLPASSQPTTNRVVKANQAPDVPLTNARIEFNHDRFDFGTVPGGAQLTHHFPVKNVGTDTLVITQIKAG